MRHCLVLNLKNLQKPSIAGLETKGTSLSELFHLSMYCICLTAACLCALTAQGQAYQGKWHTHIEDCYVILKNFDNEEALYKQWTKKKIVAADRIQIYIQS
jgi:hypothetical protein